MTELKRQFASYTSLTRSRVNFNSVQIFYFNRSQGFSCVPARGGATVGMVARHSSFEEFHIDDYEMKRRYERYHLLLRKYYNGKVALTPVQAKKLENLVRGVRNRPPARHRLQRSYGLSFPAEGVTPYLTTEDVQYEVTPSTEASEESHVPNSNEVDNTDSENEISSFFDCYILERLSIKKRKFLLQKSGLRQIDHSERVDCQAIRDSREVCGCSCPDGICLPERCQCALNNVICQIDSVNFPCSCVRASGCANPEGRLEFNQRRVRVHYIHTRMRLLSEGMCDQPQAVASAGTADQDGDDDRFSIPGSGEKRQRLESDALPQGGGEVVEDTVGTFNSNTKGSCLLCDDPEFVDQCAKSFNIPLTSTSFAAPCPASDWQSPQEHGLPSEAESGAGHAACSHLWPMAELLSVVDRLPMHYCSGDESPAYLFTDATVLQAQCGFRSSSACSQHSDVTYTGGGHSASEPTSSHQPAITDYSACELVVDPAVSQAPVLVGYGVDAAEDVEQSSEHNRVIPLAPITCLLSKLSPDITADGEVTCQSPVGSQLIGACVESPRDPISQAAPVSSALAFPALAEEIRA